MHFTCKITVVAPAGFSAGELMVMTGKASAGSIHIRNTSTDYQLRFTAVRYPLASKTAYDLNEQGWYIDVNIGGADPSLGTSAQSAYLDIQDGGLDMVINPGSRPAKIPCATGTASGGLTCSAANEVIGAVFDIVTPGVYQACMAISHRIDCTVGSGLCGMNATFQIMETSDLSDTVISYGNERPNSYSELVRDGAGTVEVIRPISICGIFTFNSVGEKVIRLEYEQFAGVNIGNNSIRGDRNASGGNRDIHVTVRPWNEGRQLVINNTVSSPEIDGTKLASAFIDCDSSASILRQDGSWIASVDNISSGDCNLNIDGAFSSAPNCQTTVQDTGPNQFVAVGIVTATDVAITCKQQDGSTDCTTFDAFITCVGPK